MQGSPWGGTAARPEGQEGVTASLVAVRAGPGHVQPPPPAQKTSHWIQLPVAVGGRFLKESKN